MPTYGFTVTLANTDCLTVAMADRLFEAGCDDATPSGREGTVSVHFDREAASLGEAVGSAIRDVEKAGYEVARVEIERP